MTIRRKSSLQALVVLSVVFLVHSAAAYPFIDESTHWTIESQSFIDNRIELTGLSKSVESAQGVLSSQLCFSSISVDGILVNGDPVGFSNAVQQTQTEYDDHIEIAGEYQLGYNGETLVAHLVFRFYKDGFFNYSASVDSSDTLDIEVPIRINYDFKGKDDDVFEFVWNKLSTRASSANTDLNPPMNVAELTYVTDDSIGISDPNNYLTTLDYWTAVPNEVALDYSGLHQDTIPTSIEYTAMVRVKDFYANLGAVFWPWSDDGATLTDYTIIFKQNSDDHTLTPSATATRDIQLVEIPVMGGNVSTKYQQYVYNRINAVDGTGQPIDGDQMMYVIMKGTSNRALPLQVAGKLFNQPNGPSLELNIHVWDNLTAFGATQSWSFNPDKAIANPNTSGNDVTFRQAFETLLGNPDLLDINVIQETGASNNLDNDLNNRRDYSDENKRNVGQWQVDLYIWPEAGQMGAMTDAWGGGNKIEKEGAFIHFGEIVRVASENNWSVDYQDNQALFGAIHEIGHTFGLIHEWSNATFMLGSTDYFSQLDDLRFTEKSTNWVRNMPESWVKPGRYGTMFGGDNYDAVGIVDPLYAPKTLAEKGDANFDGQITIVDALLAAQQYVNLNPKGVHLDAADVNCDGTTSIVDALLIAQYYVGIITDFPCD